MALRPWVRLPTEWIEQGGLKHFRWSGGNGSNNAAALLVLIVIAHHADDDTGVGRVTYDMFGTAIGLSRSKVSAGLRVLEEQGIIKRDDARRSTYALIDYDRSGGWGMVPARRLYASNGSIPALATFTLRNQAELIALKLYLLFVARRDRRTNMAHITYENIGRYTAIDQNKIRTGLSLLVLGGLIHVDRIRNDGNDYAANAYRLAYIETRRHMGTTGRGFDEVDFGETTAPARWSRAEDAI